MSSNSTDETNDRIIYKALSRMTDDFALLQTSYQFWQKEYAGQELDPSAFADALTKYVGLNNDQKRTLVIALHSASGTAANNLPPVPDSLLSSAATTAAKSPSSNQAKKESFQQAHSAHWIVTDNYMKNLIAFIKHVDTDGVDELREILTEDSLTLKTQQLSSIIQSWASSGFTSLKLHEDISPEQCAECAHFLYLQTCEALGPPQADLVLDKVIRKLNELPEASTFSPKKLL